MTYSDEVIHDAALPPGFPRPPTGAVERLGILYSSARWTGDAVSALAGHLQSAGSPALAELGDQDILDAWLGAVDAFLDPASGERRSLDPALERFTGLSRPGLQAGLEAVLGGARSRARELFAGGERSSDERPVVVVLASNLPALAVQPLLPALALRRPVLLKSPTAEPLFAPAFLAALARRQPRLAAGLAAVTWRGGDRAVEDALLPAAGKVLAYGDASAIDDLERRAPGRVVAFGPKASLAAVSAEVPRGDAARGLARDVALFDQRGCLSIQAVYTAGDAHRLADRLAAELERLADRWPPGLLDPALAAGVQQLRAEADLRGLHRPELPLAAGTVVVEPLEAFAPSPGLRTVRVHPLPDLARLPDVLAPWSGRLQGAALAGAAAERLRPRLEELGFSRFAAPAELQSPDALWHNGGLHPLEALL